MATAPTANACDGLILNKDQDHLKLRNLLLAGAASAHAAPADADYFLGLRSWPLAKLPYLVFCVENADHVDVWRVLHAERDIPTWMKESGEA